ncbi:hypothetical protein PoB_006330300 [Plakobranchus ocellatus]|uniref:Secreted protein n=1 Tax=Plakobranchus ocellatus TaxID=259542 RepID=A0AAV4CY05_9GAST|nr:hypothetical protein PoB_006330300 [Plakobranchus ocellatus]
MRCVGGLLPCINIFSLCTLTGSHSEHWHNCSAGGRVVQAGVQGFLSSLFHPQLDGLGISWTLARNSRIFGIFNIHDHRRARRGITDQAMRGDMFARSGSRQGRLCFRIKLYYRRRLNLVLMLENFFKLPFLAWYTLQDT